MTERYVLCVVDLRSIPEITLEEPWTAERVEPLAHMITDIGKLAKETWDLVDLARANQVVLRNDRALRYGVPVGLWETGQSLPQWIAGVVASLRKD